MVIIFSTSSTAPKLFDARSTRLALPFCVANNKLSTSSTAPRLFDARSTRLATNVVQNKAEFARSPVCVHMNRELKHIEKGFFENERVIFRLWEEVILEAMGSHFGSI